jgi:hypothetical protein
MAHQAWTTSSFTTRAVLHTRAVYDTATSPRFIVDIQVMGGRKADIVDRQYYLFIVCTDPALQTAVGVRG